MIGFKPRISGLWSDHIANCATTTRVSTPEVGRLNTNCYCTNPDRLVKTETTGLGDSLGSFKCCCVRRNLNIDQNRPLSLSELLSKPFSAGGLKIHYRRHFIPLKNEKYHPQASIPPTDCKCYFWTKNCFPFTKEVLQKRLLLPSTSNN